MSNTTFLLFIIHFMKRYFSLFLLLIAIVSAKANPVNSDVAREVGAKFLHASALIKSADPAQLQLVSTYRTVNNDAAFYVFNTSKGFVIVSADDCATPILGYSNESVFTVDNVPIQMEEYLQRFVEQIQYGIDHHLTADEPTARQWELVRTTGFISEERGTTAVAPLLTDFWGQGCYYNSLCPSDANGPCGHVVTGCVATSMSQILHYWGYPAQGTGSHTYTPDGYPQQTANFGATTYQWNNMPNSLWDSSPSAQVNAIATLVWHCGVAVEMMYGAGGSGAYSENVLPSLVNYFGYSNDLTGVYKNNYSNAQWLTMIKSSLNLGCPVHYSGNDGTGQSGHAFVCDGYDNNDYLHFNWGWYGNCNNYFALDALNPDGYNFSSGNYAIINIHPNTPVYEINISADPVNAGTVAFGNRDDKSSTTYDFEDGTMMEWTSLDADGDGYDWVSSADPGQYHNSGVNLAGTGHYSSQGFVISGSWSNSAGIALTPDNYLIAPTKGEYGQIKFWACAQDANYAAEHFGVAVSTTTATASAFTTIQEWTLTAKGERYAGPRGSRDQGVWYEFTADLSAYTGQEIWVAIRHFNCTDQFILNVDDITLTTAGSASYYQGESCTVMATANSGYTFNSWKENGAVVSTSANYTFTVNGNRTLVANFSVGQTQQYTVNISANPTNGGTVAFNNGSGGEEITYDFEDLSMMNWTSLDADNDGYDWVSSANPSQYHNSGVNLAGTGHNASQGYVISGSWSNPAGVALTPDNYLVSPSKGNYSHIRFYACSQDAQYAAEHFGVAVSTTTATASAFTTIQEWTLTAKGERYAGPRGSRDQGNWYEFTADLSAYTGQEIWVAIRHFNCTDQFILNVDDITLTTYNGGSASSSATFVQGQSCTVTAMPSNDYTFSNWTENGNVVSTSANYTFTVNGNRTLVANFTPSAPQPQQYTVSISANPINGGTMVFNNGSGGEEITYDFEDLSMMNWTSLDADNDGYDWVSSANPSQYHNSGVNLAGTGHNASQGYVISGSWSNPAGVALTPDNYLVSPSKGNYSHIRFYACSQDAQYAAEHFGVAVSTTTATASAFTTIQEWTLTAKGERYAGPRGSRDQGNWYEFTADLSAYTGQEIWVAIRHFNCTDQFILNVDDITLTTYNGGSASSSATFVQGQSCTVTAMPSNDYTFSNWTENGNVVSTSANYTFTVNGNRTLVANFTPSAPQPQQYTVSVSANPIEGGIVSGGGLITAGQSCTVTATPNNDYTFSNWTENGNVVSTSASYTFTVNGDRTLVANFTVQSYTITATADPIEGGQVSGGNTYTLGDVCTLSATPNTGYDFVNWTKNGNVVSANSSFSFNVTENADYVAHFLLQTFTVIATADPVEGGVIQIEGDTYYGATVTVTVLLNEEYSFLNWTENGDIVSEDQTYEFTLQDNRNLVANLLNTVGIDEKALVVRMYPNPANEKLILETSEDFNSIEIYNAMGILVYSQKEGSGRLEIQTGQLSSGTYLIQVTTDDTVIVKRFVKE